ncbi:hypothetical protein EAE99_000773 [Botrytis elliptica]|nr:hypothetical protein EAE99_000773 [Botrytis elliptica]
MSYTNQKVSSPVLGQRNFAYARNYFPARSPILGERDGSEDGPDNVSVTSTAAPIPGMSRGKPTGRSWPWQRTTTSRKPLTAMARPRPERQLSSSPEYTPASPGFAPVDFNNPRSAEAAPRSSNFNPSSSNPPSALYAHYQPQLQTPTLGPSFLPDYQSLGMHYREHFTSYSARPQNSFAMQSRQPMLPSIASDLLQKQGSMNNSNFSWTHSKVSSRKRPFEEEDDDFFAPPSKRREYSATRPFGLYNETTAGSASQTLQDSRNRVYPSGNRSFTPAHGYVEMNNSRTPANSDIYAGMVYQEAPSTPRGRAADECNNRPLATFPYEVEYTTTETAYGPNYSGTPGLVIQQKPVSTRGTSSRNSAVAPNYRYRPQTSMQLPPLATLFTGFKSHESSPSSNNNYPMEPQNNVNHGNILSPSPQRTIRAEVFHSLEARHGSVDSDTVDPILSPSPQRTIRAEVFHSLEARHGSVDSDTVDPLILSSYAPSPALSEDSTHDAENQNSNENSPVASPQEEDPIDRQSTDSATLAEDTPRQSIEAPDNFDNESVVSYHPSDNDDDENHSQSATLDQDVRGHQIQQILTRHGKFFEDLATRKSDYSIELPFLIDDVETLKQTTKEQSDKNTELRKEIRTLNAQASTQFAFYVDMTKVALERPNPSQINDEHINRLIQQSVEAGNKTADHATVNNAEVLATLRREVTELQNSVLKMQNEALMKQVEDLRALRDL